jgi:serine/threonine-protein kinase
VFTVFALLWILGAYFAHRHLRSGRGDLRGALRLALFVFLTNFASWLLTAKHVLAVGELTFAFAALGESLMLAAVFWLLYMTIEPFARRFWPRQLTSWTRLLRWEIRNPLVGRDVLLGLLAGCALIAASMNYDTLVTGQTYLHWRMPHGLRPMLGARFVVTNLVHFMALMVPFGVMTILVIARAVMRRSVPAVVAALILVTLFSSANQGGFDFWSLLAPAALILVAVRVGLLALVAATFVVVNTYLVPVSFDPSLWWAPNSAISWGAVALVAVLAYRTAVAGSDGAPRRLPER